MPNPEPEVVGSVMKILSNKEISFAARIRQGWTKEHLMSHFSLNERQYKATIEAIKRIETEGGKTFIEPPNEDQSFPVIQVYSPDQWHDDQAILMNETGRKNLIKALQSGATKLVIPAFVSDGEGYYLYVQVLPIDEIDKHKSPYTDEMCRNLDGEAEKIDLKYPVTPEERKLIEQGKDAGEWKVVL